jgi:hypothetical protein
MRSLSTFLFDESNVHTCHFALLEVLRGHIDQLSYLKAVSGKRKALESHLQSLSLSTKSPSYSNFSVITEVLAGDDGIPSKAIHEIDMVLICDSSCGETHSLDVELCVSNREAIGTNFLKLEVCAKSKPEYLHLGVLLCPDRKYFKTSNMDPSYGDDDEYIIAHQLAYHNVLKADLVVLSIGD